MNDQEIRIAIGEACPFVANGSRGLTWWNGKDEIVFDPLNDLNAMHEAEESLSEEDRAEFCLRLNEIVRREKPIGDGLYSFENVHATARQRAEAFLKTLGKWKD